MLKNLMWEGGGGKKAQTILQCLEQDLTTQETGKLKKKTSTHSLSPVPSPYSMLGTFPSLFCLFPHPKETFFLLCFPDFGFPYRRTFGTLHHGCPSPASHRVPEQQSAPPETLPSQAQRQVGAMWAALDSQNGAGALPKSGSQG